jgi:hypothetical protein
MERRKRLTKDSVDTLLTQLEEGVQTHFQAVQAAWEASQPCQQLRSTLLSTSIQYSKIVALGLGSISYSSQYSYRFAMQHALLLTLRDVLEDATQYSNYSCLSPTCPVACYVKDPAYTRVDQAVFAKHIITTLGDPKSILEVDHSTAILSCSPDIPVKQLVSDLANPAIMMVDRALDYDLPDPLRYTCSFYTGLVTS